MNKTDRPDGYDALPRRFKDYIAALESRVYALEAKEPTDAESRITVVNYNLKEPEWQRLPDKARLRYRIGGERYDVYINDYYGGIEVVTEVDRIAVLPEVSNGVVLSRWPGR